MADYPPTGLAASVRKLENWIQVGCGDKPYNCAEKGATFAPDGKSPPDMPNLSKHSNFLQEHLTKEIYDKLKDKTTSRGCTLANCIKTGVDNPGHPHIKTVGLVACDEECYTVFADLFDPVISARHGGYSKYAKQPTNLDLDSLSNTDIDPGNKYVLTTRVRTGRSVRGFMLPPTINFEDRRKLEALSVKALLAMQGDLKGDYFPLNGSRSYPAKPNGMSEEKENELRSCGNLFQEPDSTLLLASGMGRHWPDGRGVFANNAGNLYVWVGEEDHLRIVSMQGNRKTCSVEGKNIKAVTARFIRACNEVQKVLKAEGADFMHNDHLGWVLTCPSNLGTGLRAGTMVKLPKVSGRKDWKKLCDKMALQARGTGGVDSANVGGTWDVSNADRIGKGEVDLVNTLIEGAAQLVKWETMCDNGNEEQASAEIEAQIAGVKLLAPSTGPRAASSLNPDDLVNTLVRAEEKAAAMIADAKQTRLAKLREAKTVAEQEINDFKNKEEAVYQKAVTTAQNDPSADLAKTTARELQMVQQDYNSNKAKTVQYVVSKVLDVVPTLTSTQKQALKTNTC